MQYTYKKNEVNLDHVVWQERTLLELPKTRVLRPPRGSVVRKQVIELRSANLSMTMSEIARRVGMSRQRVFQILREAGLPTKHCVNIKKYQCLECGAVSPHKFCSDECKKKWQQIPIICNGCGKLFFRNVTQFLHNYRKHSHALFCSKSCAHKWLVETYGFKSNCNLGKPNSLA
jgi:AraC-like DNA-binding protein